MALEREGGVYERNRQNLLERYRGLFVLIKGDDIIGAYGDAETAFREGVSRFGMEPFLVKQVLDQDPIGIAPVFSLAPSSAPDARL